MLWRLILIGCWLLCGLLPGDLLRAQTVIDLDRHAPIVDLHGRLEWARDSTARWTPDEAAAADWQPLAGSPNAGFTSDALWLRLTLRQPDAITSWRLQLDNPLLEDVRLYRRNAEGRWTAEWAGRQVRHSEWPLDTHSPAFRLDLPPGQHTLMVRLSARGSLSTSITLREAEHFYTSTRDEAQLWGFYFGLYALVILFQLLFWLWTREPLSGWYVLYAALNCLGMLLTMGYLQNALNLSGNLSITVMSLVLSTSLFAGTKFAVVALGLDKAMPRLNRFLVRGAALVCIITSGLVLAGAPGIASSTAQIVSIIGMLIITATTIRLLRRRGGTAEKVLLAAFGVSFAGILLRYLRNLGWLQPGLLTDNSIQVGSVLHMIMMCLFILYRYNALQAALQVEQKARREQRDFVSLVSHEFRTPLAIIDTSARQLSAHLEDAPVTRSRQRCANIQAAAGRMTELMDNYLSAERMDHAESPLQARRCDLKSLLETLAAEWPTERLRVRVRSLPAAFVGDPDLLLVALQNLVRNANRHARADTAIELTAYGLQDDSVTLRVSNSGPTVPPDELPLLFRKYFRGRGVRGKPGAGLGLYLVKQIVAAHGGWIEVSSADDLTTFEIWLPPRPPVTREDRERYSSMTDQPDTFRLARRPARESGSRRRAGS